MKTVIARERPFEFLKYKDGRPYSDDTVRNMYIARAFVLNLLKDVTISPDSDTHLHVMVDGDSPMMLSVVRQLSLSAHFINFVEYDIFGKLACKNRTLITLASKKEPEAVVAELQKDEYLCNLLAQCRYTVFGKTANEGSFLDLEYEIVRDLPVACKDDIIVKEEDVNSFVKASGSEDIFSIDTRKASMTSMVYELGTVIDNLPGEDIHSASRYILALDTFQYRLLGKKLRPLVNENKWSRNQLSVRNGLSNLCCSDCFDSRARGIMKYSQDHGISELRAWELNNAALTVSEHNRWVSEKLIMGFRMPGREERMAFETMSGRQKAAFAKLLKNNASDPAHLNMCSCLDLRRSDPGNLKYDAFLLLAIPIILSKIS